MATKRKVTAAKGDAVISLSWFKKVHVVHYTVWPLLALYVWIGDWSRSALIVGLAWLIIGGGWFLIWRHRWMQTLATDGVPIPNPVRLVGQVAKAKRRMNKAKTRFELTASNQPKLRSSAKAGDKIPPLQKMKITSDLNVEADIDMGAIGRTVADLKDCSDAIAAAAGAEQFVVRQRTPGRAHVIWQFTDPLHTVLRFRDMALPVKQSKEEPRWVGGVDQHGAPMEVALNKPVMVGGEQSSGKSVFVWDLIGSLNQQGLWTKLYVIDPKGGAEMGLLGDHVGEWQGRLQVAAFYAGDNTKEGEKVIQQAYNQLDIRKKKMNELRVRKFTPGLTPEDPILVLIIDEALDYTKMWKDSDSLLMRYGRQARACGATLVAVFQYGHASEIGVGQKLFGARFCFRGQKETGDTILGTGAYERGARVNEIPASQPGVGFYVDDEGRMLRFRAAHATDAVVQVIAAGGVPEDQGTGQAAAVEREVACYRLFNDEGVALYVGQSVDPWGNMDLTGGRPFGGGGRFEQHSDDKPWFGQVVWTGPYAPRVSWHAAKEIDKVEKAETHRLGPIYNDKLNRNNPLRVDWRRPSNPVPIQPKIKQVDPDPTGEVFTAELIDAHWGSE